MAAPALGPIIRGGRSILLEDLTHATSGLPLYPGFDTGWTAGLGVLAPEAVEVKRHSGGEFSGYSIYLQGASGIKYYVTHLSYLRKAVGSKVAKGEWLGNVGEFTGARVPHAHVGINVESVYGPGKELLHNTNYTHGKPTIGAQLANFPSPPKVFAWPIPLPKWWWEWNLWLEKGKSYPRPSSAPTFIPLWAWRRRRAFLDAKL